MFWRALRVEPPIAGGHREFVSKGPQSPEAEVLGQSSQPSEASGSGCEAPSAGQLLQFFNKNNAVLAYAAFTRNGFDNQERNLTFVKTDFQGLKIKFHACNFKQAF